MTQALNLANFANNLNTAGQVSKNGIQAGVLVNYVPSGSVMLFYQSAAPAGWTQVTSLNDYALRLVSGSGGSTGGTTAFSTVFANQTPSISVSISGITAGATTLALSQIAGHAHAMTNIGAGASSGAFYASPPYSSPDTYTQQTTDVQGGGGSHTHSISGGTGTGSSSAVVLNVRYANIIICSKN